MMNQWVQVMVLADIGDVIGGLMALLVPLLWVIKQIASATKQAKAEAAQPVAPREPVMQAPPPAAGQQADPLRNQVEEFLRRAGRGPQGNRPQQTARDIEVLVDEPRAPRRPVSESIRKAGAKPVAPLKLAPTPRRSVTPKKRVTLAERATERAAARTSKLGKQAAQLGQQIIDDDAQFDVQLKAKFDHKVGTLTGSSVTAAEQAAAAVSATQTPAAQIAAMLATPDGVRQAILVNEILRRPIDRW